MNKRAYMKQVILYLPFGIILTAFLGWYGLHTKGIQIDNYATAVLFAVCFVLAFSTIGPVAIGSRGRQSTDIVLRRSFPNLKPAGPFSLAARAPVFLYAFLAIAWALILAAIFIYLDPFTFVVYLH